MNTLAYDTNMARVIGQSPGRVELAFALEADRWPWLSLPPQHPVLLEKYQYFGSLTALWALERFDPAVYTALTRFSWRCPVVPPGTGRATTGSFAEREEARSGFSFHLQAESGQTLLTSEGEGVAFASRDFKGWRARTRQKAQLTYADQGCPVPGALAEPSAVGLPPDGVSFVTPLRPDGGGLVSTALVTTAGGFHPQHPFHTGSGDHVNAGHLFDGVLQASHLVLGAQQPLRCAGGEAQFFRYVELDVPFQVRLIARQPQEEGGTRLSFLLSQLGQDCAKITYTLRG